MARFNSKTKAAATAPQTAMVSRARKVNFDNNPGLIGFFSVTTKGYPVFGKVSLLEREDDQFGLLFPVKRKLDKATGKRVVDKYKDKDGNERETNFIHPISKEVREELTNKIVEAFEAVNDEKWEEIKKEDILDSLTEENPTVVRFPQFRDVATFPTLVGDASFVTINEMVMNELQLRESKEGNYYISFPADRYEKDGEWRNNAYCGFMGEETGKAILEAAVEALVEK